MLLCKKNQLVEWNQGLYKSNHSPASIHPLVSYNPAVSLKRLFGSVICVIGLEVIAVTLDLTLGCVVLSVPDF